MKKLTTILQLPIMEILNGKKVGQVKDIVMNLDTKQFVYVLDESIVASLYVIKGEEVKGIGKDVMLIKTSQSIQNSQDDTELGKVLGEYYSLKGLEVITLEGNIAGKIVDLTVDESLAKVVEIELEDGHKFNTSQIISISDKYVFVQNGADDTNEPEPTAQVVEEEEPEVAAGEAADEKESVADETAEVEAKAEEKAEVKEKDESSYLIGLTLSDDVANEDGTFILKKGTVLTEELINEARGYGVFANLIMNAE